jgi:hypothetical protein
MAVVGFSFTVMVAARPSGGATATATAAGTPATSAAPAVSNVGTTGSLPVGTNFAMQSGILASDNHVGTLYVREGGGPVLSSIDPDVTYDTVGAEPVFNLYQTLVAYNNASGGPALSSYVPVLATCIPGTAQCIKDYGSNLTVDFTNTQNGGALGVAQYYTFVIDPNAHFYDAATGASWGVYPTDVMFSIARSNAWADLPYAAATADWIQAQALLQYGDGGWDSGIHAPFNNTPGQVLSTMLINDSTYCPAKAMTPGYGNGCITFDVNGGGTYWTAFLDFLSDNMGASIMSCGWTSAQGGGMPGWGNGTDKPCALPTGQTTTSNSAWTNYLAALNSNSPTVTDNMTYWDTFEQLANSISSKNYDPTPPIGYTAVGSGPYFLYNPSAPGSMSLTGGYTLHANPAYQQPVGCSGGSVKLAVYTGYCYPPAGKYIPVVSVTYYVAGPTTDPTTFEMYESGSLDFGGYTAADLNLMLEGEALGISEWKSVPTISNFFMTYNMLYDESNWATDSLPGTGATVPANFLGDIGMRNFLTTAFPYGLAFSSLYRTEGVTLQYCAGGPIPENMGSYYPTNVSYQCTVNNGNPITNPTVAGGEAWWWSQLLNPTSAFYDPEAVACAASPGTCSMTFFGEGGATSLNTALQDWANAIYADTNHAITVYVIGTVTFSDLAYCFTSPANSSPCTGWDLGWAPDYSLPADFVVPYVLPDQTFTASDGINENMLASESPANAILCGHTDPTKYLNLVYWATHPYSITDACQGYAYETAVYWFELADGMPLSQIALQTLYYNLATHIINSLAIYAWQGQANQIYTFAPWIDPASINTNVMQGGGGDQFWFHIAYLATTPVTFHENGLPAGASYSITTTSTSGTVVIGSNTANEPSPGMGDNIYTNLSKGAESFTVAVTAQAPHSVNYVYTGASVTNPMTVGVTPLTVTLNFGAADNLTVTEYGLGTTATAAGQWCLSLTASGLAKGTSGPPGTYGCATPNNPALPTSINATNSTGVVTIAPGTYTYKITVPAGFAVCTVKVKPASLCPTIGTLTALTGTVAATTSSPTPYTVYFYQVLEPITFSEAGLPVGTTWNVTVYTYVGPNMAFTQTGFAVVTAKHNPTIVFHIAQNTTAVYYFVVNFYTSQTNYVPTILSGYFSPGKAVSIGIGAIDPKYHPPGLYAPETTARLQAEES